MLYFITIRTICQGQKKRGCCTKEKIPKCNSHFYIQVVCFFLFSFSEEKRKRKKELFLKSWVFRGLRASIQGAALKTRQLLKKLDQNFYTCNSPFFVNIYFLNFAAMVLLKIMGSNTAWISGSIWLK